MLDLGAMDADEIATALAVRLGQWDQVRSALHRHDLVAASIARPVKVRVSSAPVRLVLSRLVHSCGTLGDAAAAIACIRPADPAAVIRGSVG